MTPTPAWMAAYFAFGFIAMLAFAASPYPIGV